jgi:hypothetical protein
MNTDPIQDFILKNERNLCIAAAVGDAWPEAREKLVSGFLDRLEVRLKRTFKGWEFERGGRFFVDAYSGCYFLKPVWENQYWIGLNCNEHGDKMVFGVGRDKPHIGKRPFCEELLEAISKLHPSGRTHSWWEARMTMRSPAADWRKPEVLWRMHKDPTFLEDVAQQLLDIAKTSERIIDRLSRKKQRRR